MMMMGCSRRFVLKKLVQSSSAATRYGASAAAVPLPRTAIHTRSFFSGIFGFYNTTREKGKRFLDMEAKRARIKFSQDEQSPTLGDLKFIIDKKAERDTMVVSLYNERLSEFTNVAMWAVAFCVPHMAPAKRNKKRLLFQQLQEEANYMYKFDDEGLHVFVNVNGLGKKDLTGLIYDDLLLVATAAEDSPPATSMKHLIKIPAFNYDHDKITADIVDGGDLQISFAFRHTTGVARPFWIPVKFN